jgi:hypothetical protein
MWIKHKVKAQTKIHQMNVTQWLLYGKDQTENKLKYQNFKN